MLHKSESKLIESLRLLDPKCRIEERQHQKEIHYRNGAWLLKQSKFHTKPREEWFFGIGEGYVQNFGNGCWKGVVLLCRDHKKTKEDEPLFTVHLASEEVVRRIKLGIAYPKGRYGFEYKVNVTHNGIECRVEVEGAGPPITASWVSWQETAGSLDEFLG